MEDRKIRVRKEEIGNGEEKYLGGKASYKRVVDKFIGERLVLCNNIVEIDENFLFNRECGFEDFDEVYEIEDEDEDGEDEEELENEDITLEELEEQASDYANEEEYNYEFYQYFIIDISNWDLEYLKECKQRTLQICYSELLDCYVLCVGHCGTSWTYVGSDFDLEVIE